MILGSGQEERQRAESSCLLETTDSSENLHAFNAAGFFYHVARIEDPHEVNLKRRLSRYSS